MAEQTSGINPFAGESTEPAEPTGTALYGGTGDSSNGGNAGSGRTRRRRSDAGQSRNTGESSGTRRTRKTRRVRMVDADEASVTAIAESIAISAKQAFRIPAFVRTAQWGVATDGHGNAVLGPDGKPIFLGDYWQISDDEAMEMGTAWARVIVMYVPEDLVERSSVLSAAFFVTAGVLGPRIMTDAQMLSERKAQHEQAERDAAAQRRRAEETAVPTPQINVPAFTDDERRAAD